MNQNVGNKNGTEAESEIKTTCDIEACMCSWCAKLKRKINKEWDNKGKYRVCTLVLRTPSLSWSLKRTRCGRMLMKMKTAMETCGDGEVWFGW